MNTSFAKIFEIINKFETIIVLRHINPDYDALGSQFGLVKWLKHLFPTKTVLAGGTEPSLDDSFIANPDEVNIDQCKGALAIAVDTSTTQRIDGVELWNACCERICIDHHIREVKMADYEYVDRTASSCAELITNFILEVAPQSLDLDIAKVLYAGMVADTQRFSISSTTANTLRAASSLLETGLNVNDINNQVFQNDFQTYLFTIKLREMAVYSPKYAYAIVDVKDYCDFGLKNEQVKSKVSIFGEIRGIQAWALFVQNADSTYSASLRSHNLKLNDIAQQYGGGGHKCACGIPGLSFEQCHEVINKIKQRSSE